jgi:hypothetical protein
VLQLIAFSDASTTVVDEDEAVAFSDASTTVMDEDEDANVKDQTKQEPMDVEGHADNTTHMQEADVPEGATREEEGMGVDADTKVEKKDEEILIHESVEEREVRQVMKGLEQALDNVSDDNVTIRHCRYWRKTERLETLKQFCCAPGAQGKDVLIGSRTLFEGVDSLQRYCRVLIWNTLPWNWSQFHQCVSRLVRKGQREHVLVFVLFPERRIQNEVGLWNYQKEKFHLMVDKMALACKVLDDAGMATDYESILDATGDLAALLSELVPSRPTSGDGTVSARAVVSDGDDDDVQVLDATEPQKQQARSPSGNKSKRPRGVKRSAPESPAIADGGASMTKKQKGRRARGNTSDDPICLD